MGNSLYGFNKVEEIRTIKAVLRGKKGRIEFKLEFQKQLNSRTIKQEDIQNDDPVCKLYIELLIKKTTHFTGNNTFSINILWI